LALKEKDVENIDILFNADVGPDEVKLYYSRDGQASWWYTQHWKGKKAQFPETQDVIDTIEQARASGPSGNTSEAAYQEVLEWIRGTRDFSSLNPVAMIVVREMGEYELKNKPPHIWGNRFKKAYDKFNPDQ
jgi:hypothetical protein